MASSPVFCNQYCAIVGFPPTPCLAIQHAILVYARRMGQPTQRATNYTARSNIDTAQIFLHANGQRPKRAMIRQRSRRRQRRGEPHTEHGLGVLFAISCARRVGHPHKERQTIPQGPTSSPPKSFLTPTAKARPNQAAVATAAETPGTTHRAQPRSPFSHEDEDVPDGVL